MNAALPAWSALIVHVPAATKVSEPLEVIEQTPVVAELKLTARPDVAAALKDNDAPNVWVPGFANVIVWGAIGVTASLRDDAWLFPAIFVAIALNR
ncbi:MAG: hypothetical protein ACK508_00065 [Lysobacteraceae bacterium]